MEKVVYILLPICVDVTYDNFFNMLKNVVHREGKSKLTKFYLDNAFKQGMMAEEIFINVDDVDASISWKFCKSKEEGIRRSKMLGYWTSINFPTLGKLLFGDSWQTPKENVVKVKSQHGTKLITSAEVNLFMFPKMKCHLLQLNVCEATLCLLKDFVRVPISEIGINNGTQISPKMKFYDIKDEHLEKCWTALKRGEWLTNTYREVNITKFLK